MRSVTRRIQTCCLMNRPRDVLDAQESAIQKAAVRGVVKVMTKTERGFAAPHAHRGGRRCLMSSSYGWSLNHPYPAQNRSATAYALLVMEGTLAYSPGHSTRSPERQPADTRSSSPSCCFQTVFELYLVAHLAYLFYDVVMVEINFM